MSNSKKIAGATAVFAFALILSGFAAAAESAADIDRQFAPTVGQANNGLHLATDQIHYMEKRDAILRRMNQYNTNSSEYQNLTTQLRILDDNYYKAESSFYRSIDNVNAGLVR